MTETTTTFADKWASFITQYINASNSVNRGLITEYESDWLSPCYQFDTSDDKHSDINKPPLQDGDEVNWRPFRRPSNESLNNLEKALEIDIPKNLQTFFCEYYSHDLNAKAKDGPLILLQAWNENDFERLQKNLIAHVLMKRRLKQRDTLFFALTDQDDLILSVLLETSEVVLEQVGKEPHQVIANDISSFILSLEPAPTFVSL